MAKWKKKVLVRLLHTTNQSPLLEISDDRIFMINFPTLTTSLKLKELKYDGTELDIRKEKIYCGIILSAKIDISNKNMSIETCTSKYEFEILNRREESERYYRKFSYIPEIVPKYSEKDIENEHKLFDDTERKMSYANADIFSNNSYPGAKYLDGDAVHTSKTPKRRHKRNYSKHKSNTETK